MLIRRWTTAAGDKQLSRTLARTLGISPFAAHLAVTRGYRTEQELRVLLEQDATPPCSPNDLPDMQKAVERIRKAIERAELICVYGDYDVDGVTATALLYSSLERLGARVMYMLPSRDDGGYGLHMHFIDRLAECGVKLLVTVDNGVSAFEEIAYAAALGIDTVVTDHHRPQETLPQAVAIVDAYLPDCRCAFCDYAGVGVAFMLACALEGDREEALRRYADLVAFGTIADSVPLTGENRRLVRYGLERLRSGERTGTRLLMSVSGTAADKLTATDVSFTLAPRVNSAGRLGKPDGAVRLLLSEDADECRALAEELCLCNARRHECEKEITEQAWLTIAQDEQTAADRVLIVGGKGWNSGVIGICAARIFERTGKPTVVLAIEKDGLARGSCRGPEGFSFHEALTDCAELMVIFGGHSQAAGFTITEENIPEFRRRINLFANTRELPVPELHTDCELPVGCIDLPLAEGLEPLEPFGTGNPAPLVTVRGALLRGIRAVGGGGHQRLTLADGRGELVAMLFGVSSEALQLSEGDRVDCVLSLGVKCFRGVRSVEAIVRDIRLSSMNAEDVIAGGRLFERAVRGDALTPEKARELLPDREQTAKVYRYIVSASGRYEPENLCARLGGISYAKTRTAIEILRECGLVVLRQVGGRCFVRALADPKKTPLETSGLMRRLTEAAQ